MLWLCDEQVVTKYLKQWRPSGSPGTLFITRQDVLPPIVVEARSREIGCHNDRIILKYDSYLDSAATGELSNFKAIGNV